MCDEIKQNLNDFCSKTDLQRLTPELAEQMTHAFREALATGGAAGYRAFLKQYECGADTIVRDGKTMRLKNLSDKAFMTPFGKMTLERKVYQPDRGGQCHVPLDAAWGMQGEFATIEVREAVLYACGLITPVETETMLKKCALFHPSSTAIKHIVNEMGAWVEEHVSDVREQMRINDAAPENTQVLGASLDGANAPLREPGVKRGRPGERPGKQDGASQATTYKNAMVGSITHYGKVPEGQKSPARLASRYLARMPEDRAPTFKAAFECDLEMAESMLPKDIVKVLVCDGARGLWKYIEENERFTDYEKILDYFHAIEHLSALSEALFGKKSDDGIKWYDKYREKLLSEDLAAHAILRSVDYYLEQNKTSRSQRADALRERTFFHRNKHRMTYADFRRRGLPIGSGIVEAACKSIVKSRLCRSGMRWTRKGGQHILHLRAHIKSNRWNDFWGAYKTLRKTA
jgi:hypothetical protein